MSRRKLGDSSQTEYSHFDIRRETGRLTIIDATFEEFALVDNTTTRKLESLNGQEDTIRLEAVISTGTFSKRGQGSAKQQTSTFLLSINIYGPESSSSSIGKRLSSASLCLQHPYSLLTRMRYDNPHYYRRPGTNINMNGFIGDDIESMSSRKSRLAGEIIDVFETDFLDANADGIGSWTLPSEETLHTKLRSHQEVAVNFIVQRETTAFMDQSIQGFETTLGVPKRAHQPTAFGGIIADVMGLGKTLTMLTAITTSLPGASFFADFAELSNDNSVPLRRTRATLVVVSSPQVLDVWMTEISQHFSRGALKMHIFHGQSRQKDIEILRQHDVVLTTYATLVSDSKSDGLLCQLEWYRIALDEGM